MSQLLWTNWAKGAFCGPYQIRTDDFCVQGKCVSRLYQQPQILSKWQGSNLRSLVPKTSGLPTFPHLEVIVLINGLEPLTSTVSGWDSNQLSYINIFLDPRTGIEPISSAYKAVTSPTKLTRNFWHQLKESNFLISTFGELVHTSMLTGVCLTIF